MCLSLDMKKTIGGRFVGDEARVEVGIIIHKG